MAINSNANRRPRRVVVPRLLRAQRERVSKATVKSMIHSYADSNMELKYHINSLGPTLSSSAGTVLGLTQPIVEGDTTTQRSGSQINFRRLDLRISYFIPALNPFAQFRIIIFYDTDNIGTVPAVTDVLQTVNVTGQYQIPNVLQRRFKILYDVTRPMVSTTHTQLRYDEFTYSRDLKVTYNAATNIPTANRNNAFFMLILTDATTNPPSYAYDVGIRFTDA